MLASVGEVPLTSADFAYEPKYDGIRALVALEPGASTRGRRPVDARVRIWSRLGNEKSSQFPEIVAALGDAFAGVRSAVLLDGEIVALDADGQPTSFLHLQNRVHIRSAARETRVAPVAFIAFDLLIEGDSDLRQRPLRERRSRLEKVLNQRTNQTIRISTQVVGNGGALQACAHKEGWEGLIAKRKESWYASGKRSTDWCKLKLVRQQTCVIGGWTEPRGTRHRFGALLLGVFDDQGRLQHVGQVGAGFSGAELDRVWKQLQAASRETSPFLSVPRLLERSHWVAPKLTCEVKFTEWTLDGKLRHPTYLGMRNDVIARSVRREPQSADVPRKTPAAARLGHQPSRALPPLREQNVRGPDLQSRHGAMPTGPAPLDSSALLAQIDAIQASGGNGVLALPDGVKLDVSNLGKVFWPALKLTKGDLFRHYVRVADAILPAIAERPLVMKRYPNGVEAKPFYQHRAANRLPAGVRVAMVATSDGSRPHVVGGSLTSLLYTSQLAAISQDPWFSRMDALDKIDAIAIDLDPPDGLPFRRVLDVALRVRDELAALGAEAFPKTSGSRGVHIFVPMPPDTPFEAGLLYAQIVATMVARKHPRHATVERAIAARGQRVYLDYMQNMRGKTLASAYSARANAWAGVSTPLTWVEIEAGVSPKDFTIATFAARLTTVGDLWAALRGATAADLRAVLKYAEPRRPLKRKRPQDAE